MDPVKRVRNRRLSHDPDILNYKVHWEIQFHFVLVKRYNYELRFDMHP